MDPYNDYSGPIDLTTPKLPAKRRSSFFNIELKNQENKKSTEKTLNREIYVEKLRKENDDWMQLIKNSNARVKALAKRKEITIDSSMLSQERKDYLAKGIDFEEYLKQYESFSHKAMFYTREKEWILKRLTYAHEQLQDKINESTIQHVSAAISK